MEDPTSNPNTFSEGGRVEDLDELPDYNDTSVSGSLVVGRDTTRSFSSQMQRPPPDTEHLSSLDDSSGRQWLSLIVKSRGPSSNFAPVVFGAQPISGDVILDLTKAQSIDEVTVSVSGLIVCSVAETVAFYTETKVLWKRPVAEPQTSGRRLSLWGQDSREKLSGRHVWPFTFSLPGEFAVDAQVARRYQLASVEQMPPSLGGNGSHPSAIDYRIIVRIRRAAFLQPDSSLYLRFIFIPLSRPGLPSPLRFEAYHEASLPLGPAVDPDGWKVYSDIEIRGILFHSREVNMTVTFALATPLCYTRGSVVPCFLTIQCDDKQALDLFSNVGAPVVRMRRKLDFLFPSSIEGGNEGSGYLPGTEEHIPLSIGVWKSAQDDNTGGNDENKRELYGELSLPRYLVPTFTFGAFRVKYVVDIYPFDVPGFVPVSDARLFRTEISVATSFAEGPRPRAYLPPGYIPDREERRIS